MIRVKVFKLSNIIQNLKKFILILFVLIFLAMLLVKFAKIIINNTYNFLNIKKEILADNLIFIYDNNKSKTNFKKRIINLEFAFIDKNSIKNKQNILVNNSDDNLVNEQTNECIDDKILLDEDEINNIDLQKKTENEESKENNIGENQLKNMKTSIINENNKKDVFTNEIVGVKIKNESKYIIDENTIDKNIEIKKSKNIIIYHTHTCESYTPTNENQYVASGNYRTLDLNNSVVRVGEELKSNLSNYNFNVIHDYTYHDYPAYNGSYNRSLKTIDNILGKGIESKMIIDLHRDALGNNSNYSPCVKIGDDVVAQLMFVIGTDGGGLEHPEWKKNLSFVYKIQEEANKLYPGLFKPIIIRNSRYNQHVSNSACIIEVGATGNTLEQCNQSMKYLANVLNEVLKKK